MLVSGPKLKIEILYDRAIISLFAGIVGHLPDIRPMAAKHVVAWPEVGP
jgi:hypothetical protein